MLRKSKGHRSVLALAGAGLIITLVFFLEAVFSKHLSYRLPFVTYGGTFKWHSLRVGAVEISLYWAAQIVGIMAMCRLCLLRRAACRITRLQAVITGVLLGVFGYVGAKILYVMENYDYVLQNGLDLGGVSFFGTVFFMPLVIPVMGLVMKLDPWKYLDFCTPAGILMLACIRCGCFMRGCCHGVTIWVGSNPVILPVQLMECTLDLLLLYVILRLEDTHRFEGGRYAIFMGAYGGIRFLLEFLRDTPKNRLGLSNGQWFSLVCLTVCVAYCTIRKLGAKHETQK